MAFVYERLLDATTLTTTTAGLVWNGSNQKTYIRSILLHNFSSTTVIVDLYCVPDNNGSDGTPAGANKFYHEALPGYATRIIEFPVPGMVMEDSHDMLAGKADTATAVNIWVYGARE